MESELTAAKPYINVSAFVDMTEKHEGFMKALKCRECGREYPLTATHVCEFDFGPLEVDYDYETIAEAVSREKIGLRPPAIPLRLP